MKIAIVGCNRGIGLELVKANILNGHEVYAFCRTGSQDLEEAKPQKIVQGFEVTDSKLMQHKLSSFSFPKFDHLYHVSGILRNTALEEFDVEKIKEQFLVNSIAPILTTLCFKNYLAPNAKIGLLTSRMGSIADNSSGGAYGYRMSKSALNSAAKSLALDLQEQKITVLLLHPGFVRTDMTNHKGNITTTESAQGLINLMQTKKLSDSGTFWHINGENLPW